MVRRVWTAVAASAALALTACSGEGGQQPGTPGDGAGASGSGDQAAASGAELDEDGWALRTPEASEGGTVVVLGNAELSYLDPVKGNDGNVNNFYRLIYRTLTTYQSGTGDAGNTVVPDLATDTGTASEDKKTWTFTLKDDIFYEDGTPIRAQDFKYALERSADARLRLGSTDHLQYIDGLDDYAGIYEDPAGLDSIETPDDKTIVFHLDQPLAGFPNIVAATATAPFPEGKVTSVNQLDEQPISSGPYKLDSYKRGSELVLVRNDKWSAETDEVRTALPDSFEFVFGLDASTIDQRMISAQGEDRNAVSSSTNPLQAASLPLVLGKDDLMARTVRDQPTCTTYLGINTTKGPLQELEVRQAISYAIDKQQVLTATGGPMMAAIATDMLLPATPGWVDFDLYPSDNHEGDPEKAAQMLADAGYPDGFELTMDVRALPKWQSQAEAVQDSLKKLGIDVNLNVIEASTYYSTIYNPSQQHDIAITGWCSSWLYGEVLLAPLFDGDRISDTGNYNLSMLDNPEINAAFDQISEMTDLDEQNAAYAELDKQILELAPVVPLVRDTPLQMVGPNVGDAYSHAGTTGYVDYASVGLIDPDQ
ncbi:ABC transporter substrate-binding protein [Ornithinimicrobium avium]|uniref:ABC transporter substrate-binding protein n=1 Tax=Ornithinimicrobium avium TaxID=2283195 RepID=A0A345NMW4_9MICO|nr:ABC transporter substrate-binding protein [Ornithinimicrobium avium]AXH96372.1 ABC transporter substrate-binding protein [Ornithinimicrobium avium]